MSEENELKLSLSFGCSSKYELLFKEYQDILKRELGNKANQEQLTITLVTNAVNVCSFVALNLLRHINNSSGIKNEDLLIDEFLEDVKRTIKSNKVRFL